MVPYLLLNLQQDAQLWEKLLFTTGGKLEIPKCVFSIFTWKYDNLGRPILLPSNKQQLHVQSSETGSTMLVPQIEPTDAYKYVGIQLALDGNMTTQIETSKTKCNTINGALSQIFMDARDTQQGYTTVFVPSVRYVLPTSSIPQTILQEIQSPTINTVLTKLGYNRHMPRAVIFAPTTIGGIGLLDLFTSSKVKIIISHIRSRSPLYTPLLILFETKQIIAGITLPALEDTTPHVYVHAPWLTCVRNFLHQINTKLTIPALKTINCIRENDRPIMNHPNQHTFTKSELESINACRLYLRVNTLAEITSCKGTLILNDAIKGTEDTNGLPMIWKISQSTLKWPHQPRPPKKSWNMWKKYLQQYTTKTPAHKLITPLGNWYNNATSQRNWAYIKYYEDIIHRTDKSSDYYQQNHGQLFNYKTYTKQNKRAIVLSAYTTPMIPIYIGDTSIRCGKPINMTNTPTITLIYQHIPITINNVIPTIFQPNYIIDIASDCGLKRDHTTFGINDKYSLF
jgi:hypothetical protein